MVHVIESPVMMTYEEMESAYDGKWVYVVKCEFTPGNALIRGMPVIIADRQFEEVDTGIYDKYDADEFGRKCSNSFLDIPLHLNRAISFG